MKSISGVLAATLLSLGIAGCSSGPDVRPDYSLAKGGSEGKGVLVFSLTTDDPENAYIPELVFNYGARPHGEKDASTLKGPAGCDRDKSDSSDFDGACGRLFAVELPAGDYYLYPWSVTLFPPLRVCTPASWEPVRVTIAAGKAVYIGDFHLQLGDAGQDRMGTTKFGAAWVVATDARTRDLALLAQRYPGIGTEAVQASIAAFPARDAANDPPGSNCGVTTK